jgi:hypothetical protein
MLTSLHPFALVVEILKELHTMTAYNTAEKLEKLFENPSNMANAVVNAVRNGMDKAWNQAGDKIVWLNNLAALQYAKGHLDNPICASDMHAFGVQLTNLLKIKWEKSGARKQATSKEEAHRHQKRKEIE